MTDAEHLFLLIAGFYLWECTVWLRTGMFVFSSQLGGKRQHCVDLRWALLQNPHGGILLGNVLPVGQAGICQQWPLSLSPQGVYGFVSQVFSRHDRPRHSERFVRFQDIDRVEPRGPVLFINGVAFAHLAAPSFARLLATTIRQLAALPEEQRGPVIIAALDRHLDANCIRERIAVFRHLSANLQITCCLLFFLVFLLPPLLVYLDSPFSLVALLGPYFGLIFLGALQFRSAHRILYPDEKQERWKNLLLMLLSPADAIHARDKLSRNLLAEFSPLAIAKVNSDATVFATFAAQAWRDLTYPMLPFCPAPDPGPEETEAWFRHEYQSQIARFLINVGIHPGDLLQPPPRANLESLSYCPRCLGQYVLLSGNCPDCGGRPLEPFRKD